MAHWDDLTQSIAFIPPQPCLTPGWTEIDCGCALGLVWHTEEPTICPHCRGNGFVFLHDATNVLALFPGGPLLGKIGKRFPNS